MTWYREPRRHALSAKGVKTATKGKPFIEKSKRKPYNDREGYIASLRSGKNKGWVVIYNAKEAGLDDSDGKYAVVCETHSTIVNTTSLPKARQAMKYPDFCEGCTGD